MYLESSAKKKCGLACFPLSMLDRRQWSARPTTTTVLKYRGVFGAGLAKCTVCVPVYTVNHIKESNLDSSLFLYTSLESNYFLDYISLSLSYTTPTIPLVFRENYTSTSAP